jgi:hypothetical protein
MPETAIQAGAPVPKPDMSPTQYAPASIKKPHRSLPHRILHLCASLRVTVVLFLLSIILIFYGTWAQVDASIWTVVKTYFRGFYAFIPFKILFFRTIDIPENYGIPFPGGWTLGTLLLINLLAAHFVRFRLRWKRAGVLVLHSGIVVMMLGEFFTGMFAIEGRMVIVQGYKSNFVESDRRVELAVVDRSNPQKDDEIQVPGSFLKDSAQLKAEELPFDIEVAHFMANSAVIPVKDKERNPATNGV